MALLSTRGAESWGLGGPGPGCKWAMGVDRKKQVYRTKMDCGEVDAYTAALGKLGRSESTHRAVSTEVAGEWNELFVGTGEAGETGAGRERPQGTEHLASLVRYNASCTSRPRPGRPAATGNRVPSGRVREEEARQKIVYVHPYVSSTSTSILTGYRLPRLPPRLIRSKLRTRLADCSTPFGNIYHLGT